MNREYKITKLLAGAFCLILAPVTLLFSQTNNEAFQLIWERSYEGTRSASTATAMCLDAEDNIYVTGYSFKDRYVSGNQDYHDNADFVTIKYNSEGETQWIKEFDGDGEGFARDDDFSVAIAVDDSGHVIVAGNAACHNCKPAILKYDVNGDLVWKTSFAGPAGYEEIRGMIIDPNGDLYVIAVSLGVTTRSDYATVKIGSDGSVKWQARYTASEEDLRDEPVAIALAENGGVYVTGESNDTTSCDFATIKYNDQGDELWVARHNGINGNDDSPKAIVTDNENNVYVTGYSFGRSINIGNGQVDYYDCLTIKYDNLGNELWAVRYEGPNQEGAGGHAIAVDSEKNVYVAGASETDFLLIKYDSFGVEQWAINYDGPTHGNDSATSIALARSGFIYVTGRSYTITQNTPTFLGHNDFRTLEIDSDGNIIGVARYKGDFDLNDTPFAIEVGEDRNLVVAGNSTNNVLLSGRPGLSAYRIIKYQVNQNPVYVSESTQGAKPDKFQLDANYPNPFNSSTIIGYTIRENAFVVLKIFNINGNETRTLVAEKQSAGYKKVVWDGRDDAGSILSSGIYVYKLQMGNKFTSRKMLYLK